METKIIIIKDDGGNNITITQKNGKNIRKFVTDKNGNPVCSKNYETGESVVHAGLTSMEIDYAIYGT